MRDKHEHVDSSEVTHFVEWIVSNQRR